jgi:DNA-binding CsgD family transcriptional regulator
MIRRRSSSSSSSSSSVEARESAAGLSNRQIADRLSISVRTVGGYLYRIFAKLGISNRDQLVHSVRLARHET